MPTFIYEAMDQTGAEVKDTIEAATAEEAQTRIRQMGYFVTKLQEKGRKKKKPGQKKRTGKRKKRVTRAGYQQRRAAIGA